MNPNKLTHKITITDATSVSDLMAFTKELDLNAKLRGKINKDGTYTLKISTKGQGTGVKDILFDTVKIRRHSARAAISRVAIREGNMNLARAMKEGMQSSQEFTVADLNALLPTQVRQQQVQFRLTPEQLLDNAFKSLEFQIMKGAEENTPITCSNFFKTTKDIIYGFSPKSHDVIAKELQEEGHIQDANLGTMGEADRKLLNKIIAAENIQASLKEVALPTHTEKNKLAKIWNKVEHGIDLMPAKRTAERAHFEKMSYNFSRQIAGHEFFEVNVGETVLGLGVAIDRFINQLLIQFSEIVIQLSKDSGVIDLEKLKTKIQNLATEGRLDEQLRKLEFGAKLLTNDQYLNTLPKDKRVPLGILGVNMANLAEIFKKPDGQFQSLRLVLDDAKTNPQGFIDRVKRKAGQLDQSPKPLEGDNVDMNTSQEQIEFSDLSEQSSAPLL